MSKEAMHAWISQASRTGIQSEELGNGHWPSVKLILAYILPRSLQFVTLED